MFKFKTRAKLHNNFDLKVYQDKKTWISRKIWLIYFAGIK
jgi:hypothetical protein